MPFPQQLLSKLVRSLEPDLGTSLCLHPPLGSCPPAQEEELELGFDYAELAQSTDGYSGSDLKNLCIAAAYCPIREFLEAEKGAKQHQQVEEGNGSKGGAAGTEEGARRVAGGAGAGSASGTHAQHVAPQPPAIRPTSLADFRLASKQVTASSCSDSATMAELRRWNDQYGEGGSRQKEQLHYYT